jgi:tetratricopeptide (TPR) repeat protein
MPDYTDNFDNIISGSGLSQSAIMAMADIGFLTRFDLFKNYASRDRNASAALVLRNFGPPALGEPLPTAINASFSYKPLRPLTIALDFNLPLNLTDIKLSEKPNASLGISVNVASFLSMHAGFMYKAGSSRITVGSAVNLTNISIDINYTLDLLTQFQPMNRISLGVRLDLGDGGRRKLSDKIDDLYLLGHEAFSRGNYADARLCWEEAIRLNPKYEPAIESLAMLDARERLFDRVDNMQRLEL